MSFPTNPIILVAAIGALLALGAVVVACKVGSSGIRALMVVVALVSLLPMGWVFVAAHPELVDGRFRTYKAFYRDIQVGMTREQVLAAMEQRYPLHGPPKRPIIVFDIPRHLGFFMNPETSREPNCEGIFLTLEQGHVIEKRYSPD
jgi:hypothetical protein